MKINITNNIKIEDINEQWNDTELTGEVEFSITKESSFCIFAEGVALAFLRQFVEARVNVSINIERDLTATKVFDSYPIFSTIFGFELLYQSKVMKVSSVINNSIRGELGNLVWKSILSSGGTISTESRSVSVFSRHDYLVPRALRITNEDSDSLPKYNGFKESFNEILKPISGDGIQKDNTYIFDDLIEWMFHSWENVHEHGRFSNENGEEYYKGINGISINRYAASSQESTEQRSDLTSGTKAYLNKILNAREISQGKPIIVASCMDSGEGIQNTLGNGSLDSLRNSFIDGITRKATLPREKAGFGLGKLIVKTFEQKAYLSIVSANYHLEIDLYSYQTIKDALEHAIVSEIKNKKMGTSITILWPDIKNIRQLPLPIT